MSSRSFDIERGRSISSLQDFNKFGKDLNITVKTEEDCKFYRYY